jgi:hypothetical protein
VIDGVKAFQKAGVTQIAIFPGLEGFRDAADEISHELIASDFGGSGPQI